jgi:hypothetical protein
MNALSPVIPLEESRAEPLANILSRIFSAEPPFPYLIPDAEERRAALPGLFSSAIRASQLYGQSFTTPAVEGGSLWIAPDRNLTIGHVMRTSHPSRPSRMSWSSLKRCLTLGTRMEQVRRRLARHPHWYLVALGVGSSSRENTLREALIEPVIARADSDSLPCYVETFHERDLPFYERHGFRIEGSGRIPGSSLDFWAMMRTPRRRFPLSAR